VHHPGPGRAHTLLLSATLCISFYPVVTSPLRQPCSTVSSPCPIYIIYLVVFSLDLTYFHWTWPSPNSGCSLSTFRMFTCRRKYSTLVLHSISTLYSILYISVWNQLSLYSCSLSAFVSISIWPEPTQGINASPYIKSCTWSCIFSLKSTKSPTPYLLSLLSLVLTRIHTRGQCLTSVIVPNWSILPSEQSPA